MCLVFLRRFFFPFTYFHCSSSFLSTMEGDTTGKIHFFSHTIDGGAPYLDATPTLGWTESNYVQVPTQVTIHDLRGKEDLSNLDTTGFEVHRYDGAAHDEFEDNSDTLSTY